MDAYGKQLHMRGSVYDVRHNGERAYMLPLIERVRERSFEARVEAIFLGAEALAWVEKNRAVLRAGTTLNDLDLRDIHPRAGVLCAVVFVPPSIAPPRHPAAAPVTPSQEKPAHLERQA